MKILHLTKTRAGGAGVAATRTVAALRGAGVEAELWTEGSAPALDPGSGTRRRWLLDKIDSIPTRLHWRGRRFASWSNNWMRTRIAPAINAAGADLVHVHWVAQGFMSPAELRDLRAPVVWTMHDAWPFTGGCHYPGDCLRHRGGCGCCPQLASRRAGDLSARNHAAKRAVADRVARWITPSAWLAKRVADGGIVPCERLRVVPNTLDGQIWSPGDSADARRVLGLPAGALVLVAGAMDLREARKGCQLLPAAVAALAARSDRPVVLLLFGDGGGWVRGGGEWLETRALGLIRDERAIARVFSAADAVLMPSLQDNLPNVAVEAQACGCPVVGFASGGISEIVADGRTGLLTPVMTADGLATAVEQWLRVAPSRDEVVRLCRERQESLYAPAVHAAALQRIYAEVLAEVRRA